MAVWLTESSRLLGPVTSGQVKAQYKSGNGLQSFTILWAAEFYHNIIMDSWFYFTTSHAIIRFYEFG